MPLTPNCLSRNSTLAEFRVLFLILSNQPNDEDIHPEAVPAQISGSCVKPCRAHWFAFSSVLSRDTAFTLAFRIHSISQQTGSDGTPYVRRSGVISCCCGRRGIPHIPKPLQGCAHCPDQAPASTQLPSRRRGLSLDISPCQEWLLSCLTRSGSPGGSAFGRPGVIHVVSTRHLTSFLSQAFYLGMACSYHGYWSGVCTPPPVPLQQ